MFEWLPGKKQTEPNSLVYDKKTGQLQLEAVKAPFGRRRPYRGKRMYSFVREVNGTLYDFDRHYLPKKVERVSTKYVFNSLDCKPADDVWVLPMTLRDKIAYGVLIAFGCVALFICYLMMDMVNKGPTA